MQNLTLLLAQTSESSGSIAAANPIRFFEGMLSGRLDALNHPAHLTARLTELHPVWALVMVLLGAGALFNGFRWHKLIITALTAFLGVMAGLWLGGRMNGGENVAAGSLGLLFAIVALPGLKFATALFAGLTGAFLGANVWTASGGQPESHHLGAIIGLVSMGMLAFISFRNVTILLTGIAGASLLVLGSLGLLLQIDSTHEAVSRTLSDSPLVLPIIAGSLAAISVILQFGGGFKGLMAHADRCAPKPKPAGARPA
jgi:hypothetical protein